MTDKKLDKLLERYCAAEPETSFEYKPSHKRGSGAASASKNRLIAAAAAVALVSAVSIGAYMMFGNRFDVSTAVEPVPTDAVSIFTENNAATEKSTDYAATEPHTVPPSIAATQIADRSGTSAPAAQIPTDTGDDYRTGEAETSSNQSVIGDQSVTERVPETPSPTLQSASPSTEAPTQQATEPDDEPPLTRPTESEVQPVGVSFNGVVDANMLTGDGNVYSRIFDDRGRQLGDSDAYSPDRLAVIVGQDGDSASVQYTVPEGLLYKEGYYNIVFYNEDGKRLAQGQLYIQPFDADE